MKKSLLFFTILLLLPIFVLAQSQVTGVVKDKAGESLIGVNILEIASGNGTATDIDGSYAIEVASLDNAKLEISYVGYETVIIEVAGRTNIDIILAEDSEVLEEVIVTALGLEQKKDNMGATVSVVNTEDVVRSGETLLLNGLAGKASNLKIARSNGEPGAGVTIQIRGANTITGSSQPLIILDGVAINNTTQYGGGDFNSNRRIAQQTRLNDLNPDDIESIQLLKGASAASLWGSSAANGVLVITTKKGKAGKIKISLSSSISFDEVLTKHPLQKTFGQGAGGVFSPTETNSWGDKISDRTGEGDLVSDQGARFIAEDGTVYYPILEKRSTDVFTDRNFRAVFQTGHYVKNTFQISGGSDKSQFFLSAGRIDHDGIIPTSFFNKTNLTFNNTTVMNDWLTLKTKANYIQSTANKINQSSNVAGLYIGLLRTPPDFYNRHYKGTYIDASGVASPSRHRAYRNYLGASESPAYNNPIWTILEQRVSSKVNRIIASSEMNIRPTKWLIFTLRGGVDNYGDRRDYFFPIGTANADYSSGRFIEDNISFTAISFDIFGRANFDLSKSIGLTVTSGWNYSDEERHFNSLSLNNFEANVDLESSQLNTAVENSVFSTNRRFKRSNRGYAVFAFDIKDQLFVNISNTLEAASTLKGNFYYPSYDVAWQFSDVLESEKLSFGKLRASWGQVGVDAAAHRFQTLADGQFSYSTFSDPLNIQQFGGGYQLDQSKGNPNLRPEIKTEWEIGSDLRFFDDNLGLSFTYYQNEIKDLLYNISLAASSGFLNEYTNIGVMQNKGFEMELNYNVIKKKDLNVEFYGNFSKNDNKVTNLRGASSISLTGGAISSRAVEGEALGVLWGTRAQREETGNLALDENGFPQLNSEQGIIGDPNADWRAGAGLKLRWKGFNFNLLFDHSQGGDFAERTRFVLYRFGTHEDVGHEVTLEENVKNVNGDVFFIGETVRGNLADFGAGTVLLDESWYTSIGGGFLSSVINEFSIGDATWTRLREVSLSYSINNSKFQAKTKLGSITLGVTGRNLFLWTDIKGIDPEVNQYGVGNGFGIDYFTNPTTRSFLINLNITY